MAITYPVDVENTKWSLYKISTAEVVSGRHKWCNQDGVEPVGLDPDFTYLLEVNEAKPTYDSATHKIEKTTTIDVPNNTITQSWDVKALKQTEIDERTPANVEINGIKMATDLQSQAAFSNMMTLLNEAGMADTEMVMIKDCFGASHAMTLADFRTQAVAYGLHCYQAFHSA
jgi:hypothetical protein